MPSKGKYFLRKFFCEGQALEEELEIQDHVQDFIDRHRKYVALLIPFCVVQIVWCLTAIRYNWLELFPDKWPICLMMVFGALVGGMTCTGGGAVSFPVMTIILKILPHVARDFTLIIQSVGLTCAAFSIMFMNIQIDKFGVILGALGCIPGFILGVNFIDPNLKDGEKKMLFVSIWSSFAISLYILNRADSKRVRPIADWQGIGTIVLFLSGFVGGCFTSFSGSGVDIAVFSMLTLFFRVSEKVATPTAVILMAINSLVGLYYQAVWEKNIAPEAWDWIKVSVPIVAFFAPLGSFLGSHFHRKTLACTVYLIMTITIIGFILAQPPIHLLLIGLGIMISSFFFFHSVMYLGKKRIIRIETEELARPV